MLFCTILLGLWKLKCLLYLNQTFILKGLRIKKKFLNISDSNYNITITIRKHMFARNKCDLNWKCFVTMKNFYYEMTFLTKKSLLKSQGTFFIYLKGQHFNILGQFIIFWRTNAFFLLWINCFNIKVKYHILNNYFFLLIYRIHLLSSIWYCVLVSWFTNFWCRITKLC